MHKHPPTNSCPFQLGLFCCYLYPSHFHFRTKQTSSVDLLQNMGVRVSQVKPSNCFRRLEKLVLPSTFDTSLSSLMMWNLQSYPTTVLNERMWHFRRGQNTLWPLLHIFKGSRPLTPGSMPLSRPTYTQQSHYTYNSNHLLDPNFIPTKNALSKSVPRLASYPV